MYLIRLSGAKLVLKLLQARLARLLLSRRLKISSVKEPRLQWKTPLSTTHLSQRKIAKARSNFLKMKWASSTKRSSDLASLSYSVSQNFTITYIGVFLGNNYIQAMRDIKMTQQTIKRVTEARKRELKSILTAAAKRVYFGQENFAKQWLKFVYFEHFKHP